MAQGNMPEAGTGAGARWEVAPSAYGGIEAGHLVVLAKPLPSGAGYCTPFAVVRFEDLPEELRRQIAAARPRDPNAAPVAAPLRGEGDARLPVHVVPDDGLRRQMPGLVSGPNDEPTVKFAGDGSSDAVKDYSERRILRLVVCLDAARLQRLGDMEGGSLFQKEKGFSHASMGHSGDSTPRAYMGAFYNNSLPAREDAAPIVALLLGNDHIGGPRALDCSDGLTVPFVETLLALGNGRDTQQGKGVLNN